MRLPILLAVLSSVVTPRLQITNVRPTEYQLSFSVFLTSRRVLGRTDIKFELLDEAAEIVLHCEDLEVHQILLYGGEQRNRYIVQYQSRDSDKLVVSRVRGSGFPKQAYHLRIQYIVQLKREGIYLTSYTDENGNESPIIATHFEPTHARKAFPCFDRPDLKARFTIIVEHEDQYTSTSNMPVESRRIQEDRVVTSFLPTRAMSTYLVAFTVNNFEKLTISTKRGVKISALHRPGWKGLAKVGLTTAKQSVEFFESYLLENFPLPKLDIVPLPDFSIGGMENWGLITIRENMFYTKNSMSFNNDMITRAIVVHEVAHMWFGDLVSIRSWDDLWIKEGMAQVMMFTAMEQLIQTEGNQYTQRDLDDSLYMFSPQVAFASDSKRTTHPVKMNVSDISSAAAGFDSISYTKSLVLLRMLEKLLGKDSFRIGLSTFIKKFKLGSVTVDDFLLRFESTGSLTNKMTVRDFMNPWLLYRGYPVIDVIYLGEKRYRIRQSRFVDEPGFDYKDFDRNLWPVPVTLRTSRTKLHQVLLTKRSRVLSFSFSPGFVKLNVNNTMYFRTNYDAASLRQLQRQLRKDFNVFSEQDRISLVSDVLAMTLADKVPPGASFDFIRYLENERSFLVWIEATNKLTVMKRSLSDGTSAYFRRYVGSLMRNILNKVSKSQVRNDLLLTSLLKKYGIEYDLKDLMNKEKEAFESWKAREGKGVISVQAILYGVAYLQEDYFVWEVVQRTTFPDNLDLIKGLAVSGNITLLQDLLQGSLTRSWVPLQNIYEVLLAVARYHPGAALSFLMENYEHYWKLYGSSQFNFSNILGGVVGSLRDPDDYNKSKSFFGSVDLGSAKQAYISALETVKSRLLWKKSCERDTLVYFQQKYQKN